jgi:hypothetical protein
MEGAVEEQRELPGGEVRGPTRRAVIQHRMRLAMRHRAVVPALADLAEEVLAVTVGRWGDLRLEWHPPTASA